MFVLLIIWVFGGLLVLELLCVWFWVCGCIAYNLISCFLCLGWSTWVSLFVIGLLFCGFVLDCVTLLCVNCWFSY